MPYIINRYRGNELTIVEDATVNDDTSLLFPGRNTVGYGEVQNENFLHLLENFSNSSPPLKPLDGQLWYDTSTNALKVYNGEHWQTTGFSQVSEVAPSFAAEGSFWLNSSTNQLFVYRSGWSLIGPETVEGFGETKIKSTTLIDTAGSTQPVLLVKINDITIGVISNSNFFIRPDNAISGFDFISKGFTFSQEYKFIGSLTGNSSTATTLETARTINGIVFDGSSNIEIRASTSQDLIIGNYLIGGSFDGSVRKTISVDASTNNILGKVVARDSQGNFSAGTITADLIGNVQGNVNVSTGNSTFNIVTANQFIGESLSGNAFSASRLQTSRLINGVAFNGTSDITVTAEAGTLTGNRLANNVVESNLQSVGNLISLNVNSAGINIGPESLYIFHDQDLSQAVIRTNLIEGFSLQVTGTGDPELGKIRIINNTQAGLIGADQKTTILPRVNGSANLGTSGFRFNHIYGNVGDITVFNTQTINSTSGDNNVTINSNLIVEGNLAVNGNVTTINSTITTVNDLNIVLANNITSPVLANGAGITINGANATLTYSTTGDKWVVNKDLDALDNDFFTTGLYYGTATSARYADLAEKYLADADYEEGTVLVFGGENEVTISRFSQDSTVAGVVSKNPAFIMNDSLKGIHVCAVALQGRVPVKVLGYVKKGDMMTTATEPGYAAACYDPKIGTVIGKALEDFVGDRGMIEVVVGRI